VRITLSLDRNLVKRVRGIAADRNTTLPVLVRDYLESLVAEDAVSERKQREREALEHSFKRFQIKIGKRSWTRAEFCDLTRVFIGCS
jgi:P2-related tail formation protein